MLCFRFSAQQVEEIVSRSKQIRPAAMAG